MNAMIPMKEELVYVNDQTPVTNSLLVAKYFEKNHYDVLRAIDRKIGNYSKSFAARNFAVSEYKDSTGRYIKKYELTRDGFWAVVMGFTGEKATKLHEIFIEEFNRRGQIIAEMQQRVPELAGRKYKHRYSYFHHTGEDNGTKKVEFKQGSKTIEEMNEAENSARLCYKYSSAMLGLHKKLLMQLHSSDRFNPKMLQILVLLTDVAENFHPKYYGLQLVQTPLFTEDGKVNLKFNRQTEFDILAAKSDNRDSTAASNLRSLGTKSLQDEQGDDDSDQCAEYDQIS